MPFFASILEWPSNCLRPKACMHDDPRLDIPELTTPWGAPKVVRGESWIPCFCLTLVSAVYLIALRSPNCQDARQVRFHFPEVSRAPLPLPCVFLQMSSCAFFLPPAHSRKWLSCCSPFPAVALIAGRFCLRASLHFDNSFGDKHKWRHHHVCIQRNCRGADGERDQRQQRGETGHR